MFASLTAPMNFAVDTTGAMKTRCVRRLEGDNVWNFAIPESVCWQSVECNSKEHAADTNNPTKGWTVADVQKWCICATFWTSTDALQGAQVVLELGSTQACRARIEQGVVNKGGGEIVEEPDANLKEEPDFNPGGASSLTADTPRDPVRMRVR